MQSLSVKNRPCGDGKASLEKEPRPTSTAAMAPDTYRRETDVSKTDQNDSCLSTVQEKPERPGSGESSVNSVTPNSDRQSLHKEDNLTFQQIVELIQSGESIPGTPQLNIQPTNQTPTKPALKRVPKPWET